MANKQPLLDDMDLKRSIAASLEYAAEAHYLAGNMKSYLYLRKVAHNILTGEGAIVPQHSGVGPVTPDGG